MDFDELRQLLISDRTVRRWDHAHAVGRDTLLRLVELARWCASGRNAQPLRYRLVNDEEEMEALYPALKWAGYYADWDGPEPGERPAAYLVQCLDTALGFNCLCDDGLQLQAITLGAKALGLSGCIVKAFDALAVSRALGLPEHLTPRYVLALGKGVEQVVVDDMAPGGDFKYWRDTERRHHVPKRTLDQLVVNP